MLETQIHIVKISLSRSGSNQTRVVRTAAIIKVFLIVLAALDSSQDLLEASAF